MSSSSLRNLIAVFALAMALASCAHASPTQTTQVAQQEETRHHFGTGVDPEWAARVYALCDAQAGANNMAYNRCLEAYAEYD